MLVQRRPGYYVEKRYYRDNFHQARARACFLANEYGRPVLVMYLAPEDMGHTNTAVPYEVARGVPTC